MSIIRYDLPAPPEGRQFCPVCVMVTVGRIHREHDAEGKKYAADGHDNKEHWIKPGFPVIPGVTLRYGVVMAVSSVLPTLGLALICWEHVGGIGQTGRIAPAGPIPPGLLGAN